MDKEKVKALTAARKAQTHLGKVIDMLEQDQYCLDVLQQALAVQGLWKSVIRRVFANHMRTCFSERMRQGNGGRRDRAIAELIRVMELTERS
jgi:DNA-binding FrmR family transcriptional regulator